MAYWLGVMQTDGSLYKRSCSDSWKIGLGVADKSLPMLKKFSSLSKELFGMERKIIERGKYWYYDVTVTKFMKIFQTLHLVFSDPPKPPEWCVSSLDLFGAYLAGVIDGDGDIRIRRPAYPQCAIRISSGSYQIDLRDAIERKLKCGVSVRRAEIGRAHV